MPATPPSRLIDEIGGYLSTFLHFGRMAPFSSRIDPELNINGIDTILRVHFALRPGVMDFIDKLPERMKRIKTKTEKKSEKSQAVIDGQINWNKTIGSRYAENPDDMTHFIINRIERSFHTNENQVLRELLTVIQSIIDKDLKPALDNDHPWLNAWMEEKGIRSTVKDLYLRNSYMKRISQMRSQKVKDRIVTNVKKSRIVLYKEAANLLSFYRKIMRYDLNQEDARSLLRETFILPEKTDVLFELYWTFRVIQSLTDKSDIVNFNMIDDTSNCIAEWEDTEHRYLVYYKRSGEYTFQEVLDDEDLKSLSDGFLRREAAVIKASRSLCLECFGLADDGTSAFHWVGTPDIFVHKIDKATDTTTMIYIAKVRYTNSQEEMLRSLKDLMECMVFVRDGERYLTDEVDKAFINDKIRGWLFVDTMDHGRIDNGNLSIIPMGETIPT